MDLKKIYLVGTYIALTLLFILVVRGCTGMGSTIVNLSDKTEPVSIKEHDFWDGGADPSISAKDGGNGFDAVAERYGWETSDIEPTGSPDAVKGGRIVMQYASYPSTLRTEGMESNSYAISFFGSLIYETLLYFNGETMDWKPRLASHWKVSDDKQTFHYRLDPRARWADGMPVTADDVVASWMLRTDDGINAPSTNSTFKKFDVIKISPYIVKVIVKDKNWRRFNSFSYLTVYPAHYLEKVTGEEYLERYNFTMMPGSGPYLFSKEKTRVGKHITVSRRSDYWAEYNPISGEFKHNIGQNNFDEIRVKVVSEPKIALEKFKKGELDIYFMGRSQWWNEDFVYNLENPEFDRIYRGLIQVRKIFGHSPEGFGGICMNLRRWPFDNKNVRKALDRLWDREGLIKELFFDEYVQGTSYFPAGKYMDPDHQPVSYDPKEALSLLEEAGYARSDDGWITGTAYECAGNNDQKFYYSYESDCNNNCDNQCEAKDKRLEFTFGMAQGNARIFTIFQEDLGNVGIKMNIKYLSGNALFKKVQNERDFDVYWGSWVGGYFPAPWYFFHSKNADKPGTVNFNGFKDPTVDKLIDQYRENFNISERVELIRQIDDILLDETLYLLGWQAPYTSRVLYWNKFGHPKHYIGYDGDWQTVFRLWWYDPEKFDQLADATDNKEIKLEKYDNGKYNVYYDEIMGIK